MSFYLRILLIIGSFLTLVFVIRKMKKSKMQVFDTIIWIFFSLLLVLMGLFPQIVVCFSGILGVQSSVNCVYLFIIFFLIIQLFMMSVKISNMEYKMKNSIEYFSVLENLMGKELDGMNELVKSNDKETLNRND